jgi:hypothetical protein
MGFMDGDGDDIDDVQGDTYPFPEGVPAPVDTTLDDSNSDVIETSDKTLDESDCISLFSEDEEEDETEYEKAESSDIFSQEKQTNTVRGNENDKPSCIDGTQRGDVYEWTGELLLKHSEGLALTAQWMQEAQNLARVVQNLKQLIADERRGNVQQLEECRASHREILKKEGEEWKRFHEMALEEWQRSHHDLKQTHEVDKKKLLAMEYEIKIRSERCEEMDHKCRLLLFLLLYLLLLQIH